MQSLLGQLSPSLTGQLSMVAGIALFGLLSLQGGIYIISSARRAWSGRKERELARRRLEFQVEAARLQCQELEQKKLSWSGYRKFVVRKKVCHCNDVYSFYLEPHDRKALPTFKPGQYITFQLNIPGLAKPVVRCYSLSDCPRSDFYRVTIKRATPPSDSADAPVGIASSYFCDKIQEGHILDVRAPAGNFFLDTTLERPVVLISGGVGITPMLSMLTYLVENKSQREVWFFFGARNGTEHIEKERLNAIAREHENVHLHVCYSKPRVEDKEGDDYQHAERVSVDLMKRLLPSSNYDFFLCGPGAMMKTITDDLKTWGVPDKHVFFEAFGPATVKKAAPQPVAAVGPAIQVSFSRTGKVVQWNGQAGSLLDLAEANGLQIEAGCRAGNCGTCAVAIKSGTVELFADHPGAQNADGTCLTCVCRPKSDLVLDA
jgi:ferredoxin-NADP reductase